MSNPWKEIKLSDYENHMKLDSILQLQALNQIMKKQFLQFPVKTIMVLGVAGGNGLEHIKPQSVDKLFAVDINSEYLKACKERYPYLKKIMQPICIDLLSENCYLPHAQLIIANLLIEYIGYECFQRVIVGVAPEHVSCVIQINIDAGFVSDSPYIHVFDNLECVHHQIDEQATIKAMNDIGYNMVCNEETVLPNKKKLVRFDFRRC
ncbi:methyltransferase type 11 [Sedimentibacter sp.]|uniref:methyltransferase type 11 n=1 Tax=Sedimentibacter sp. TaxID=1960295 RepID=UPI0028AA8EC1|nr:methyltransferase type 11 [Sedimentibacter sp.]